MDSLIPFGAVALLIVVTPGPDLALVTRAVLHGGRRDGLLTAVGITAGAASWALAAAIGLAALLSATPAVLDLIRWLGAGYLGWLGIRALLGSTRPGPAERVELPAARGPWIGPLRIGLVSNLLHPGQAMFYTSMLPQFIDADADPSLQVLQLGGVFAGIVLAWFMAYAVLASALPMGRWRALTPALSRITGIALIGFAIRLVVRL